MIPVTAYLAAGALVIGTAGGLYGGYRWRDGMAAKADLAREQAAAKVAARQAETALRASQQLEVDREAIESRLRAAQARLSAALAVPVPQCPGVELGSIRVPGAALCGLRDAAGQIDDDPDACKPGPAVSGRAAVPGD